MRRLATLSAVAAAAGLFAAGDAAAITTVSGAAAFTGTDFVSAQFRNGDGAGSAEAEIYVSPDADAGDGNPRDDAQVAWANATYEFAVEYSTTGGMGGGGLLTASISKGAWYNYSAVYGDDEALPSTLSFDTLELYIANGDDAGVNGDFLFSNVELNGTTVGSGSLGTVDGNELLHFTTSHFTDFILSGDVTRSGPFSGTNFRPGLAITAGTVNPIPLPAGAWVLISAFGAAFGVRRVSRKAA